MANNFTPRVSLSADQPCTYKFISSGLVYCEYSVRTVRWEYWYGTHQVSVISIDDLRYRALPSFL